MNQLNLQHKVRYSGVGDFIVNDEYTFEIGGKSKTHKQLSNLENSWIVADNIESSTGGKIPLWLFGFLY
jgi:hypothetical protein